MVAGQHDQPGVAELKQKLSAKLGRTGFNNLLKEAANRKGVVLGLSEELLMNHPPQIGDHVAGTADLKVNVPGGLELRHITGLEPMGQTEWRFFTDLQEKYQ